MANLHKKMTFVDDIGNSQNTKGREAEHGEHGVNHTSQGPEKNSTLNRILSLVWIMKPSSEYNVK